MIACPRKFIVALAVLMVVSGVVAAQEPQPRSITYRLSMSRPMSHLFEVSIAVELPNQLRDKPLQFQMAKWSPGRYAVFDFARTCRNFAPTVASRVDDQTWSVDPAGTNTVTVSPVSETTFQDVLTTRRTTCKLQRGVDLHVRGGPQSRSRETHNPAAAELEDHQRLDGPRGQTEWQFPNWDVLVDTPTEIAPDWTQDTFEVDGKKYHVVVHSFGAEGGKRPGLVKDIEKIVRAQVAMWGPPEFTYYTFLIHYAADDHSGDGMEHLTSTQIIEPGALGESGVYEETLGTVSHEFFHVWNVKRLRPEELGPWDFTRPLNTRGLWIAEGFTNYYGHLMLRRAGIWNDKKFWNGKRKQSRASRARRAAA